MGFFFLIYIYKYPRVSVFFFFLFFLDILCGRNFFLYQSMYIGFFFFCFVYMYFVGGVFFLHYIHMYSTSRFFFFIYHAECFFLVSTIYRLWISEGFYFICRIILYISTFFFSYVSGFTRYLPRLLEIVFFFLHGLSIMRFFFPILPNLIFSVFLWGRGCFYSDRI